MSACTDGPRLGTSTPLCDRVIVGAVPVTVGEHVCPVVVCLRTTTTRHRAVCVYVPTGCALGSVRRPVLAALHLSFLLLAPGSS
jgi:hypothetical protein